MFHLDVIPAHQPPGFLWIRGIRIGIAAQGAARDAAADGGNALACESGCLADGNEVVAFQPNERQSDHLTKRRVPKRLGERVRVSEAGHGEQALGQ